MTYTKAPHECDNCGVVEDYLPLRALLSKTDWWMNSGDILPDEVTTKGQGWLLCPDCVWEIKPPQPYEEDGFYEDSE